MKVSCVTLSVFAASSPPVRRVLRALRAVAIGALSAACHRAAPPVLPALSSPPSESIVMRFVADTTDTRTLVRHTLFNQGIQVESENRKAGWMRANLGGMWEDRLRYKQWYVVASYYRDHASASNVVVLRAIEQSHSYLAGTTTRSGPQVVASAGVDRVGLVSDASQGRARDIWNKLEQLAFALGQVGAERVGPPDR